MIHITSSSFRIYVCIAQSIGDGKSNHNNITSITSTRSPSFITMSSQLLVFGASGISGLGVVQEALQYPTPNTFARILGLTNRPLNISDVQIPSDPRVTFYPGFDLTQGHSSIVSKLKTITNINQTTHVAFLAYVAPTSNDMTDVVLAELKRVNVEILKTAITSIESLSPGLEHITIQSGSKAYGVEYLATGKIPWNPPQRENMAWIPEPYASSIFYYAQTDTIAALSKGKSWQWTDIRPDAVIGFVPNGNAMDLVGGLSIWLSMYRWSTGEGAEVVFPGNEVVWSAKHTDTSQMILGKSHIYAAVTGKASGRAVNIGDGTSVYKDGLWADICVWFGLKGIGPKEGSLTGEAWVLSQKSRWDTFEGENGLRVGTVEKAASQFWFMSMILSGAAFDRHYDLGLSKELGFPQSNDTAAGYHEAFKRLRKAKLIA
jgi:nucleoside-diphosphate-sugar epimerase